MTEEKNNINEIDNTLNAVDTSVNEQVEAIETEAPNLPSATEEAPAKTTAAEDISKVKIRTILKQRFKKCGFKKVISYILVAVIFFAAGIGVDRTLIRHRMNRGFRNNRPGMMRQFPNSRYNNMKPNFNNNSNNQQNP